ncbi:MAG: hypothetical protein ACQERD_11225 [Campylobacterota bacterium]
MSRKRKTFCAEFKSKIVLELLSGGDVALKELFANNENYKKKLQEIKLTDTIFYIARVDNV